jgi:hypothetical protein
MLKYLMKNYKIMFTVPESHALIVREAMGKAGAGLIGNYDNCSLAYKVTGYYRPLAGANPFIGQIDKLESVDEIKIETVCTEDKLKEVIQAINSVHPYDQIAMDVFELTNI